jgi:hypothetical protein
MTEIREVMAPHLFEMKYGGTAPSRAALPLSSASAVRTCWPPSGVASSFPLIATNFAQWDLPYHVSQAVL